MAPILDVPDLSAAVTRCIHYAYPIALLLWFVASQAATVCTLSNLSAPTRLYRKRLFVLLQLAVISSYVVEAALMCLHPLAEQGSEIRTDNVIYLLVSIIVWGIVELALLDTSKPVWYPYYGSWMLSLVSESILLFFRVSASRSVNLDKFDIAGLSVQVVRILVFMAMPLGVWALRARDMEACSEESARLLGESLNASYGAMAELDSDSEGTMDARARMLKKIEESGNWWTYAKSFALLWPYIWPKRERWLQFSMVLVGGCLLVERALNVMVPHQLGVVTNSLMLGHGEFPWIQLVLYVLYRWLDSGSGVQALQQYLWMPVDQFSYRALTTAAYNHVMSLSYDFHSNKKTGEVWHSISQGRSVNGFIESMLFQVLPMLVDLCVAFGYFFIFFDIYMALIVAVVSVVYLWVTTKLSAMKSYTRRDLNTTGRNEISILIETISSWTTVSYFNRVPYEQNRFSGAVRLYQQAERKWLIGLSVLGVAQSLIFTVGLLAASFMAVYQVTQKGKDVGSFVTLLSYWAQLSQPLNFFANFYRKVQMQMLDAERLLELFQTKSSITDCPNALHLEKVEGDIRFENVCFSYDSRKQTISDISFHVPAGSTVAFVGETGGGKTTCLKLLFRFYDVASGSIKIDGHDIRDIKLDSMRDHMGVVPQDPQLFNDTVMNNIRYANFDATDEDVYDACRAASIHDKILSFSDGYNSKVGERGVRLSGGELQRVAIARAILKNPKIILLDEATSMIDMETERQIQDAFKRLSEDRTMLIVAHRLSTIMNADLIIVIKEGSIVEKGSHEELINAKGKYHRLWSKQLKPDAPKPEPERKKPLLIDDLFDSMEETDSETARKNAASSSSSIAPLISGFSPPPNYGYVEPSNYGFAAPSNYGFTGSSIVSFPTQIDIPGFSAKQARNSLRAAAPRPAVTFSLPERTVWNPQIHYLPTHNPRITAPNHGILKNVKSFQGPVEIHENPEPLYIGKSGSCRLKADAKEFVPKGLFTDRQHKFQTWPQVMGATPQVTIPVHTPITAATAYIPRITAPVADSTKIADNMSALFEKPPVVSAVQTPECLAQEAPVDPTVPDKIEISNGTVVLAEVDRTALEALGDAQASGSEDVGNADVETDNPQDTQRKRRKRSRRKIKSRTSEAENSEHTQTWNSDDKAADATPAGSFEPQQTAATGKEEAGSLNGNISKAKRRFRSGYKHKGNESEADSEVSAPPAPLSSTENGTRQINGKPKSGPPSRIASKKEDQAPGSSLPKRSESVPTGVTKRDGTHQRKSSVSGKGSWRGPRKPKSITESGISTSEA